MMIWEIISLLAFIIMLSGAFLIGISAPKGGLCSMIMGIIMGIMAIVVKEHEEERTTPTPLDVYRGKTTLEITYRDSVAVDSTVVYKIR